MAGISETLELDISQALMQVDQLESAIADGVARAASEMADQIAEALSSVPPLEVEVAGVDASVVGDSVTGEIENAAATPVVIDDVDATAVTDAIEGAVGEADTSGLAAGLDDAAGSLDDIAGAADAANTATGGLSSTALQAAVNVKGLAGTGDSLGVLGSSLEGLAAKAGSAGAGLAAVVGVAFAGVSSFEHLAAEISRVELLTGATDEQASQLVGAFEKLGVNSDKVTTGLFRLGVQINNGTDHLGDYGIAVARTSDGTVDLVETLFNVADAVHATTNPTEQAAIAFGAFGRQGLALLPVLRQGSAGLTQLGADAKIVTDEQQAQAKRLQRVQREVGLAFRDVTIEVGEALIPVLEELLPTLIDVAHVGGDVLGVALKVLGPLIKSVGVAFSVLDAVLGFIDDHFGGLADVVGKVGTVFAAVSNPISLVDDKIVALAEHIPFVGAAFDEGDQKAASFGEGLVGAAVAALGVAAGLDKIDASAVSSASALDVFNTALEASLGVQLSVEEASSKFQKSIDDLSASLKANGDSTDLHSEKGRANAEVLRGLVSAAGEEVNALVAVGDITDTVRDRHEALEQRLDRIRDLFPQLAGPINDYITDLDAIPTDVRTFVTQPGIDNSLVESRVYKAVLEEINALDPESNVTLIGAEYAIQQANNLRTALNQLQISQDFHVGGVTRRAGGGTVGEGELTLVGENGPELARFPAGTRITPNRETERVLAQGKTGDVIINTQAVDADAIARRAVALLADRSR